MEHAQKQCLFPSCPVMLPGYFLNDICARPHVLLESVAMDSDWSIDLIENTLAAGIDYPSFFKVFRGFGTGVAREAEERARQAATHYIFYVAPLSKEVALLDVIASSINMVATLTKSPRTSAVIFDAAELDQASPRALAYTLSACKKSFPRAEFFTQTNEALPWLATL